MILILVILGENSRYIFLVVGLYSNKSLEQVDKLSKYSLID